MARFNYLQYHIARIRLINFHNFVNETIDLRKGGHLFLLGPNGSGKSTVIDAVHVVLSASMEIELNAAARVGGRKDEGRSLQGVVMRYDRELGIMNEGGGISYAALELVSNGEEKRVAIGLGIEATTMEAKTVRWGFIVRNTGVDELPLLIAEHGGHRPATRQELESRIDKSNVYSHWRYRKVLAEEFFASEALYEQVTHLWNTGKAYREICARAGDFQNLLMRLLPEPDSDVFDEIIRSLAIIQEFESKLEQLEEQQRYLERLAGLLRKIDEAREEEARYDWLVTYRELDQIEHLLGQCQDSLETARAKLHESEGKLIKIHEVLKNVQRSLADLRSRDESRLLSRLEIKRQESERQQTALQELQLQLQTYEEKLQQARNKLTAQSEELWAQFQELREAAAKASQLLGEIVLPGVALDFLRAIDVMATEDLQRNPLPPDARAAIAEQAALSASLFQQQVKLEHELEDRHSQKDEIGVAIAALEQQREWMPQLPGYAQCLQRLEDEGATVRPLYKMLEWQTDDANLRSAIEELLGMQVLGTLVLDAEKAGKTREIVLHEFPGIPVAEPALVAGVCPAWIAAALDDRSGGLALRLIAATLAAAPEQQAEFESKLERLAIRGMRWHAVGQEARLIGSQARQQAFDREMARLRAELAKVEQDITEQHAQLHEFTTTNERLATLTACLQKFGGPDFQRAFYDCKSARQEVANLESFHAELQTSYERSRDDYEQLVEAIAQLEKRVAAAGLDKIAAQIKELEKQERLAEHQRQVTSELKGGLQSKIEQLQEQLAQLQQQAQQMENSLAAKTAWLRQHVAEAAAPDIRYYVLSTRGGDKFKSTEAIMRRRQEAHDVVQAALVLLQGTGEDGIHYRQYAGIFGFSYVVEDNKIIDRQHQPLQGVLKRLQHDTEEQREILNEKNKDLLDRLIMDSLSRHLTDQVIYQDEMIGGINRLLRLLDFDGTVYQFSVKAKPDFKELVEMVRRLSLLDEARRLDFRGFIEARLDELSHSEPGAVPEILDYRNWFDYRLTFRDTKSEATELTRRMRLLGSGGEQAVPNYLLVLAMAYLVFQNSRARLRPMLFDEAFYGIDATRRDRLLEFTTKLGIQLFVASPDQDGHTEAVKYSTTVFVRKDENRDVHLAAVHSHHLADRNLQETLFEELTEAEQPLRDQEAVTALH